MVTTASTVRTLALAFAAAATVTWLGGPTVGHPATANADPVAHDPESNYNRCVASGQTQVNCCDWSGGVWGPYGCVWLADVTPAAPRPSPGATAVIPPGPNQRGVQ